MATYGHATYWAPTNIIIDICVTMKTYMMTLCICHYDFDAKKAILPYFIKPAMTLKKEVKGQNFACSERTYICIIFIILDMMWPSVFENYAKVGLKLLWRPSCHLIGLKASKLKNCFCVINRSLVELGGHWEIDCASV